MMSMSFTAVNPASGLALDTYDAHTPAQIAAALDRADAAFELWRFTTFDERAELMNGAAARLESEIPVVAEMLTSEMGHSLRIHT